MADLSHFETPAMAAQRFRLLSVEKLLAEPPFKWRIKSILPETGVASIFGPSGSGKSFLGIDLAIALSDGETWFGFPLTACSVTYCALEGAAGIVNRIKAYWVKHPSSGKQLRFLTESIDIRNQGDMEALAKSILTAGASDGVVIIDTLNRATPGADENASKDMGQIISGVTRLQAMIGGLIILIHHTGKDETRGLRGHSSLHAALDVAIEVKRIGKSDKRTWQLIKSKDGSEGEPHPFKLEVVTIGVDEDRENITSCVVAPSTVNYGVSVRKQGSIPTSKNQRIIYQALQEYLSNPRAENGEAFPSFVPVNQTAIRYGDAARLTKDRLDCEDKRKAERAKTTINGLVKRGWLIEQDDWLWLP